MDDEEDNFYENDNEIFFDIGIYLDTICEVYRDKLCDVLLQLVTLHGCRALKSEDSELFCLSSAATSTLFRHYESDIEDEFKYYISDDEIFVDPELE